MNLVLLGLAISLLAGCVHTPDACRTRGQIVADARLTANVKRALNASAIHKFPYVRVVTFHGVTQLSGFVMKETQRQEAGELARYVIGLKEVINNISIADRPETSHLATGPALYGPHR
jgi:osmotically-inducible protein OsmY